MTTSAQIAAAITTGALNMITPQEAYCSGFLPIAGRAVDNRLFTIRRSLSINVT